jgi:peptidyl-prolyl cis-trans isomerase SurA
MIRGPAMPPGLGLRVAVVLSSALLSPALIAPTARAEIANRIVATIDGDPITAYEAHRYSQEHPTVGATDEQMLDALITDKLLEKEIQAQGISARDEEIDRYIKEVEARNGMDDATFAKALAGKGLTLEAYRAKVKSEIEKAQLVNREIRQRVNVSREEIKRHYDAHLSDYATDERVTVRDIVFALDEGADDAEVARVRAKAEEVRAMAVGGRDFGGLAKQFSEGPGADKGGELGTFARGEMDPALADVVFRMKVKEVSEPIRLPSGFHLVRVDERVASGHRPIEDVSDAIRDSLYNDALEERFQNWLSHELRERHHVEVLN